MVPAAGAAHLDHVDGERLLAGCQAVEFLGGPGGPGHLAELLAEYPRDDRELLFPADRADHVAALAVELRGPQQVGAGVADFRDTASPRVDLGEQRPPLQRVVHHLPLCSHGFQSTCGSRRSGGGVCCVTVSPRSSGANYSAPVSPRQTPQTRARDIDRVNTCARLDLAYADGQLDASEHREFVARAQSAKTLRELADLVRDLQPPVPDEVTPRAGTTSRTRRVRTLAGVVAAVAVVIGGAVAVSSADDSPEPPSAAPAGETAPADGASGSATDAGPIVADPLVEAVRPLEPGGLRQVVDGLRAEFGDTVAYELALYPKRAVAGRALPDAPDRIVSYGFDGGWQRSSTPTSSRFSGYRDFDAALIDAAALDDLLVRAPGLLGAPDGTVTHVIIRDDGTPTMNLYVDFGNDRGNGYLKAAFDGSVLRGYR